MLDDRLGVGDDRLRPGLALIDVEVEEEQVLGVADDAAGADDRLLAGGDLRLALHELERRERADVDAHLVVRVQLLGELEALLGDGERVARREQVPVGVLDVLDGRDHLEDELLLRDVAADLGDLDAVVRRAAAETAQQRLRVGEVEAAVDTTD